MSIFRFNRIANSSDLRVNIGDDGIYGNDRFMVGTTRWEDGIYYPHLIVGDDGKVGIGTEKFGEERLAVNGKIKAREILVDNQGWPDYVFHKSYQLPKLEDVEKDILKLGHLPGIPSAKEVKEKGVELGDMNARLLQKIEELTLYLIELKKQNEQQQKAIDLQNLAIEELKSDKYNSKSKS